MRPALKLATKRGAAYAIALLGDPRRRVSHDVAHIPRAAHAVRNFQSKHNLRMAYVTGHPMGAANSIAQQWGQL